jgi:hypothetical protein
LVLVRSESLLQLVRKVGFYREVHASLVAFDIIVAYGRHAHPHLQ